MKAILIFTLMFMSINLCCKKPTGPINLGFPDYRDMDIPPPSYPCMFNFKACVQVIFENGDPCTTAYARCMRDVAHADSNGIIKFQDNKLCDDPELYGDTSLCTIWNDASYIYKHIVWQGQVVLITGSSEYPDPQIIVIPN